MGIAVTCKACGFVHDNMWSCERAKFMRSGRPPGTAHGEAEVARPVDETPVAKPPSRAQRPWGQKFPVPELPEKKKLIARLAEKQAKLERYRQVEREKKARWRNKRKGNTT